MQPGVELEGPVRPPRAVTKGPKESAGLLMNMIRTLTASQNSVDREREKTKLEKEFRKSDQRLDDLVVAHRDDLTVTMQAFSKISSRIAASREKLQVIKDKLTNSKIQLHCKRDELRKLWLEAVEHKHVLQLLEEIESLMEVPDKIEGYLNKKHYLHATELLVSSVSLLEGCLEGVDALKEVKADLLSKKEQMYELLVEELHKHLYVRSTSEVLWRLKRQGSERLRGVNTPSKKTTALVGDTLSPYSLSAKPGKILSDEAKNDEPLVEDITVSDPEEDSSHFISILVKCLSLLNKIPEAVEQIKERSQKELLAIVRRTGQQLSENAQFPVTTIQCHVVIQATLSFSEGNQQSGHTQNLQELLELIFEQFRCVARAHDCVLSNLRKIASSQSRHGEVVLYDMADIWSKIQSVLEIAVGEYLDIHNTASTQQQAPPGFTEATGSSDIASYFAKKRNIKPKKFSLFRFDSSSHAISMQAYFQEQKEALREKNELSESLDSGQQYLVCLPGARNVVVMFNPLMKFIQEIEAVLHLESGNHCPLYAFLIDCARVFLGQVNLELENLLDHSSKSLDTWKVISDPEVLKTLEVSRPLLQSTITLDWGIQELKGLMDSLPLFADHILDLIRSVLHNYKETCLAAYRGIVQPESEDKRIISTTWAKDEDISRFLRSLPNWRNLQDQKTRDVPDVEEPPEEVRLRNKRESEILTSNLARDTLIPTHEILPDVGQLRVLAQLQESLEWFGARIIALSEKLQSKEQFSSSFGHGVQNQDISPSAENPVKSLEQLAKDFVELGETCLLVLHLEVRVHCFYFLLPVATQGSFASRVSSQEPDNEVVKLNKDLSSIDEAMNASLQPRKLRYIFEGLGHLIATILINSTTNIKRINENGVKKMCRNIYAIQQNLTSITMSREVALDHARQYFELFYLSPEEILNSIVERGPQFQAMEYINALQLIHRSTPGSDPAVLEGHLSRLKEILNEVPVAI